MYSKSTYIGLCCLLAGAAFTSRAADAPNAADAHLRESLRTLTLQLRTAQSDLATAQASQATLAEEKKTLTAQLEVLRKQVNLDKSTADKTSSELKARIAAQDGTIAQYRDALEKTRTELKKANEAAKAATAQSEKVQAENIVLERKASDRETKNLALFVLANQILTRYEDFSLGKALAAKEPFVGKSRVKLENLMQDYQDQIDEQRATP